jgi:hypothetical protein
MSVEAIQELVRWIRRIMQGSGRPVQGAIAEIHAHLAAHPDELLQWWDQLGVFWLKQSEGYVWRKYGVDIPDEPLESSHQEVAPPTTAAPRPRNQKPDWLSRSGINPMDIPVPIGASGVRKRIGDWTGPDAFAHAEFFHMQGTTMLAESAIWRRIGERLGDETLESALVRLPNEDREFLSRKIRKPLPAPALVEAA